MRHSLNLDSADALSWLSAQDNAPRIVPVFPVDGDYGLVVAHLVSGSVVAEVITSPAHFKTVCGDGIPLGRLYFQIRKNLLYTLCPKLTPDEF